MSTCEHLSRDALTEHQLQRLHTLLGPVLETNAFYRQKLNAAGITRAEDIATLDDLARLPFTTRAELSADQVAHPPYGTNLTYPPECYTRIHQTSGTTGQRLRWLDTAESWDWWGRCWARSIAPLASVTATASFSPSPLAPSSASGAGTKELATSAR